MLDVGSGPPLLLIPGIQGRWEWMQPSIDALAKDWRVVSRSLPGEPGSGSWPDGDFDAFIRHIDGVLDAAGIASAVVCGVSFGGLIALRYAARRPERVRALILVSTPNPRWKPKPALERYMRHPTLSSPLFFAGSIGRFWPEVRATFPTVGARLGFCVSALSRVAMAPAVPTRMSRRARLAAAEDFVGDCARISAPTLVVTGEPHLDRVVRYDETVQYLTLIKGARHQQIARTGHLGIMSAPARFAAIVAPFAAS